MITYDKAREIAEKYIEAMSDCLCLKLLDEHTIERDFGWVFFYNTTNPREILAGNSPIIIDRKDGSLHETGTAYPTEHYIANYQQYGTPHPQHAPG